MASTTSGANSVMRKTRRTWDGLIFSALAILSIVPYVPDPSKCRQRNARANVLTIALSMCRVTGATLGGVPSGANTSAYGKRAVETLIDPVNAALLKNPVPSRAKYAFF